MLDFSDFTIKWCTSAWEREGAYQLRRQVFCDEQGLFAGDDRDATDARAQLLVAVANHGGWHDRVVGTVRIHQQEAGVWWGSRLALAKEFRGQASLAAALIRLAVCSANGLGCQQFWATVQAQNELLFRRLRWQRRDTLELAGQAHVLMQARLNYYPPCTSPRSGFVLCARSRSAARAILPMLLETPQPTPAPEATDSHAA